MLVKRWLVLIYYLILTFAFGYTSYASFKNGASFWLLWAVCSVVLIINTILLFYKEGGLSQKVVIADHRIIHKILKSLAIAHVYMMLYLIYMVVRLSNGALIQPIDIATFAIISSFLVFAVAQVFQFLLNK